jgi:hypothetical protein
LDCFGERKISTPHAGINHLEMLRILLSDAFHASTQLSTGEGVPVLKLEVSDAERWGSRKPKTGGKHPLGKAL